MNKEMMRVKKASVGTKVKALVEQVRFDSSEIKTGSIEWVKISRLFT
jgi:hypothetical protein